MICAMLFFALNANCLFISTIPSFASDNGVKIDVLATIMSVTGVCEVFCRIGHGLIADRKVIPAITQLAVVLFLSGMAAFVCALVPDIIGKQITVMILCPSIRGCLNLTRHDVFRGSGSRQD